jgi:flagellar hook-length control protein FliK
MLRALGTAVELITVPQTGITSMQPNFAFDPAPLPEFRPGPGPADRRPAQTGRPEKSSAAAPRSFSSSLREARQRDREASRTERSESGREPAETEPQSCRETKGDKPSAGTDTNERPTEDGERGHGETDGKTEEKPEQPSDRKTEKEEGDAHEQSGAEAAALAVFVPDIVAGETGAGSTSDAAAGDGSSGSGSPDIAEDLRMKPAETVPSAPKLASAGSETATPISATGPDGAGRPKGEAMNTLPPAGTGESRSDNPVRSPEDSIQKEAGRGKSEKAGAGGLTDTGPAASRKSDPGGLAGEQIRPPKELQAGQKVSGQPAAESRSSSQDDAPAARSGQGFTEQQGAGRIQGDLQQTRENNARIELVKGDEAGQKPVKVSAGAKDTALMHQQDQNFDRLMESNTAPRSKEDAAGALRAQTLNQIVNKASYHLKNGQNSVRIDLKPEFLGQVRMHIVTVEHQVSVRITTELPMVKEMLDNHLQQLKAALQQQGLDVDEIEVSVSTDAQHNARNHRMPFEEASSSEAPDGEDTSSDFLPAPEGVVPAPSSSGAVDMFV